MQAGRAKLARLAEALGACARERVRGTRSADGLFTRECTGGTGRVSRLAVRQRRLTTRQISLDHRARVVEAAQTVQAHTAAPTPTGVAAGATITVTATGYSLPGHTSTGLPVGPGVVAVDPAVIPLGTRLTIPGYGEGVAADTGSAVSGYTIDLWFPTLADALAWGRRTVTITLH